MLYYCTLRFARPPARLLAGEVGGRGLGIGDWGLESSKSKLQIDGYISNTQVRSLVQNRQDDPPSALHRVEEVTSSQNLNL